MKDDFVSAEHLLLALSEAASLRPAFAEVQFQRPAILAALQAVRGSQRVTSSNPEATYEALAKYGADLTHKLDFLSLGIALVLGTAGLPTPTLYWTLDARPTGAAVGCISAPHRMRRASSSMLWPRARARSRSRTFRSSSRSRTMSWAMAVDDSMISPTPQLAAARRIPMGRCCAARRRGARRISGQIAGFQVRRSAPRRRAA